MFFRRIYSTSHIPSFKSHSLRILFDLRSSVCIVEPPCSLKVLKMRLGIKVLYRLVAKLPFCERTEVV